MYGWWIVALMVVVGHFGLHLTLYNRINATGLSRRTIQTLKFIFMGTCALIPVAVVFWASDVLVALATGSMHWDRIPAPLAFYGALMLLVDAIYGPPWLLSRPSLNGDAIVVPRTVDRVSVGRAVGAPLAVTAKCRWMSQLPLNQIFELAIEQKELPVPSLPPALDGLKIAHLSDVHLTGHVSPAFYRYVVERACQWGPDLIALTGDLVDRTRCVEWLDDCFASAAAPYGCFFVLGNHDLRVADPRVVRGRLAALGWRDLGGRAERLRIDATEIQIIGNEAPWFPAPPIPPAAGPVDEFRLLLSHSPDQLQWARARQVGLMLAGHTHGGQGRLPWIGPVLSPSWYGSRYASGTFHLPPTTMHVTRGLSGVHLMRVHCPPELALLTLRCAAGKVRRADRSD